VNWTAVAAVSDAVGAVAVVFSLIYLAIQIRAQNRESRAASIHDILEAFRTVQSPLAEESNAQLYIKAMEDFESLSDAERLRLITLMVSVVRVWEEAFHQHKMGRLDDELWRAIVAQYSNFIAVGFAPQLWNLRRHAFTESFQQFVDQIQAGQYKLK